MFEKEELLGTLVCSQLRDGLFLQFDAAFVVNSPKPARSEC